MKSVKDSRWLPISSLLVAALWWPPACPAQDYHPLEIGSQWEYTSTYYGHQTMTITGERVVLGAVTRVRHQAEDDQVYENFWTKDDHGNLFLHGARNLTHPFEIAYLPPIQMVSSPLWLGKAWVTDDIYLFDLDGNLWGGDPMDYPLRVYTEGVIDVPAGQLYAYGVGYDIGPRRLVTTAAGAFDLLGRRLDGGSPRTDNATDWYVADVGVGQFGSSEDPDGTFRLVSYGFPPVPVEETTWGRTKSRFVIGDDRN